MSHPYTDAMTTGSAPSVASASLPDAQAPAPTLRSESEAVYAATAAAILGVLFGFVIGSIPGLPLWGDRSFGATAAIGAGVVAAASAAVGYWRVRLLPGHEWRQHLPSWTFTVNTISVVIVHTVLAVLAVLAVYLVLGQGFQGLLMNVFWSVVLMAVTLGLTAYSVYLSVSQMTTQRMSMLLMSFVVLGTLTAMATSPDPDWWQIHFSHLGSFPALSSYVFNGTLIAGGLLVTTFALYIANDMRVLVERGVLTNAKSPRVLTLLLVVMGIMLAFVGVFPVNVNLLVHNLSAMGMAAMYLGILIAGPWLLRGMPRTYFLSSWAFLAALVVSVVLFVIGYFGLTAFEIIVFALIFGWIAVFIRFLGVTGQTGAALRESEAERVSAPTAEPKDLR